MRLEPANAAKLYALVEQQGLPNTKVVVTGDVRIALARHGMPWSGSMAYRNYASPHAAGYWGRAYRPFGY